ncbi:MAG: 5'-methylthioadenosine/S-adenosylhomocysteine nucleosidase [bacterium]|nr:5'-methylthioadenosine/S-adenosylhomocysteine nucleosidase [bacterium]
MTSDESVDPPDVTNDDSGHNAGADDELVELAEDIGRRSGRSGHNEVVSELDVLLVAAVKVEWQALLKTFPDVVPARYASGQRWAFGLHACWLQVPETPLRYRVGLIRGFGSGPMRVLPALLKAVETLRPQLVIMCGIAAGTESLQLGDVVVAKEIISLETGRRGDAKYDSRTVASSQDLLQRMDELISRRPSDAPQVVVGDVLAQPDVIRDRAHRDALIKLHPNAVGIEMEGGALTLAMDVLHQVPSQALLLKSIVDYADHKDNKYQASGAMAAASLAREFIETGPIEGGSRVSDESISPAEAESFDDSLVEEELLLRQARSIYANDSFRTIEAALTRDHAIALVAATRATVERIALVLSAGSARRVHLLDAQRTGNIEPSDIQTESAFIVDMYGDPSDPLPSVRRLRRSAADVVVLLDTAPDDSHPELATYRWEFFGPDDIGPAMLQLLRETSGPSAEEWLGARLATPAIEASLGSLTSIESMERLADVLSVAAAQNWDQQVVEASLGDQARRNLAMRIAGLSSEQLPWFMAAGVLQGYRTGWIEHAALVLQSHIEPPDEADPSEAGGSMFLSTAAILEHVGARVTDRPDGKQTYSIAGVAPAQLIQSWWEDFARARPALLSWMSDLISEVPDRDADGQAWLLTRMLNASLADGLDVIGSMLKREQSHRTAVLTISIASSALAKHPFVGDDGRLVLAEVDRWSRDKSRRLRGAVLLLLAGDFASAHPKMAVEVVSRRLRERPSPGDRRACVRVLADLLTSGRGGGEVHDRLLRWMGSPGSGTLEVDRRELAAQDALDTLALALVATPVADGVVVARLASLLERLATMPSQRDQLTRLLKRTAALAAQRDDATIARDVFRYMEDNSMDRRGRVVAQRGLRSLDRSGV